MRSLSALCRCYLAFQLLPFPLGLVFVLSFSFVSPHVSPVGRLPSEVSSGLHL